MTFYSMFLYTSLEILLYVVSIFNTSANAKSSSIFIRIPNSLIFSFHPIFPDYCSSLRRRSLTSQELTSAVPLTY